MSQRCFRRTVAAFATALTVSAMVAGAPNAQAAPTPAAPATSAVPTGPAAPRATAPAPQWDDLAEVITIPDAAGVAYLINGAPSAAGRQPVPRPAGALGNFRVTVTAQSSTGTPLTGTTSWVHNFPEIITPPAPEYDDAGLRMRTLGRPGVVMYVQGWNDGKPMRSKTWEDMAAFAGQTVRVYAEPGSTAVRLTGQTEWLHTFPSRANEPTYDDLRATITIPALSGLEYQIDGVATAPGVRRLDPAPFGGRQVKITATRSDGSSAGAWSHTFPEVIQMPAPVFDNGQTRVQIPGRRGVILTVQGETEPLRASSWNDLARYAGKPVTIVATAAVPRVTLLTGATSWTHTFPDRPDYPITFGDEFNGDGVARPWLILNETKPSRGKGVYKPENLTVRDGALDIRISRHCLAQPTDDLTEANRTTAVCPAGTTTRYSTGRINSGLRYGAPKSMEVRAKLDPQHVGLTATAWMHNSQPFCNNGVTTTEIAEFDVMELWDVNYATSFSHITCDGGRYRTNGVRVDTFLPGEWHTYRVEWDGYGLRYFFDGQPMKMLGADSYRVTAASLGISQERFSAAINDNMWQVVIGVHLPENGSWAPWIDDSKPFTDRHDLIDYVRVEPFDLARCTPAGAIGQAYAGRPDLGAPVSCETDAALPGSRIQLFTKGRIYWSPGTGAQIVHGAIGEKYVASGGEQALGLPVANEIPVRGGFSQRFERGTIFFSGATGAHWSRGLILDKYASLGWENGQLGYPTSDEVCGLRDGGCYQNFQGGAVLWSPASGAHPNWGMIRAKYAETGFESGQLGYPTSDEVCGLRDGGCYQNFQGGAIIWSPASGAHPSWGEVRRFWAANGFEFGRFGYPIGPESCGMRGQWTCTQNYQGGVISWSPGRGAWG